jgi:hypothetical protein
MNRYGSYRKLLGNSIAAMSAAIEIYNKPKIEMIYPYHEVIHAIHH